MGRKGRGGRRSSWRGHARQATYHRHYTAAPTRVGRGKQATGRRLRRRGKRRHGDRKRRRKGHDGVQLGGCAHPGAIGNATAAEASGGNGQCRGITAAVASRMRCTTHSMAQLTPLSP